MFLQQMVDFLSSIFDLIFWIFMKIIVTDREIIARIFIYLNVRKNPSKNKRATTVSIRVFCLKSSLRRKLNILGKIQMAEIVISPLFLIGFFRKFK